MTDPLVYAELGRCATPGCRDLAGHGLFLTMCQPHADRLAVVRAEYLSEGGWRQSAMASASNGPRPRGPRCYTSGCDNARIPPADYCAECVVMGMVAA